MPAKPQGVTPSQTVGPYFAYGLTSNGRYDWNDAFSSNLVTPDTSGVRVRVEGRVFDGDGQPVPDCMLEIWQADAQGRFNSERLAPQVRQSLENICAVLAQAQAGPQHIVRLTWYGTSRDEYYAELADIGNLG